MIISSWTASLHFVFILPAVQITTQTSAQPNRPVESQRLGTIEFQVTCRHNKFRWHKNSDLLIENHGQLGGNCPISVYHPKRAFQFVQIMRPDKTRESKTVGPYLRSCAVKLKKKIITQIPDLQQTLQYGTEKAILQPLHSVQLMLRNPVRAGG